MTDFPHSYLRHTLLWTLPGGEVASSSCAWKPDASGIVLMGDGVADALAAKGLALWNAIKGSFPIVTNYVGSRIALLAPDGSTIETKERGNAPANGFADAHSLPTECAIVASLKTATYSRSGRGRMYLPPTGHTSLQDSGRLTAGTRDNIADGMQDYLAAFTDTGNDYDAVVASKTTGVFHAITQVLVGDVVDSQRRRRDALTEVSSVRSI